jgi:ATP synthase F1 delta subunit
MATASNKHIAYALYEATYGKQGKDLNLVLAESVEFLAKKQLLSKAPDILKELEKIIDQKEGIIRAQIHTSTHLTDTQETEIKHQIKERYKANEVHLEIIEDKKLLGGIKIHVADEIIDLTLAHTLSQLQNHLTA